MAAASGQVEESRVFHPPSCRRKHSRAASLSATGEGHGSAQAAGPAKLSLGFAGAAVAPSANTLGVSGLGSWACTGMGTASMPGRPASPAMT
eukprot:6092186-Alexandrium_andersonii.AAC.1